MSWKLFCLKVKENSTNRDLTPRTLPLFIYFFNQRNLEGGNPHVHSLVLRCSRCWFSISAFFLASHISHIYNISCAAQETSFLCTYVQKTRQKATCVCTVYACTWHTNQHREGDREEVRKERKRMRATAKEIIEVHFSFFYQGGNKLRCPLCLLTGTGLYGTCSCKGG